MDGVWGTGGELDRVSRQKVIVTAKRLWDKYILCGGRLYRGRITKQTAGSTLSAIVNMLMSMPIHMFGKLASRPRILD
jgi:threonine/homoserine efflux transporter RhtA